MLKAKAAVITGSAPGGDFSIVRAPARADAHPSTDGGRIAA
ncbi:hypothetical protein [Labrys sp. LIt4]|nr:hypothetical protein [Labrys sp. LIt4]